MATETFRFKIPTGADDQSIHMPRPKWEMPKPPDASEQ
jgi:hypothetical protein